MNKQPENYNPMAPISQAPSEAPNKIPEETSSPKTNNSVKMKKKCVCKGFPDRNGSKKIKTVNFEKKQWFREQQAWKDFIKKHRIDLINAKPVVDDKPPKLNFNNIYDVEVLNGVRQSLKNSYELNQLMVKSLYEVNMSSGKTDTFNFNYEKPVPTNYNERKAKTQYIESQNRLMSTIIKKPNTTMKTAKEYAEDWKKIEMAMENNSQFPLYWKKKEVKSTFEMVVPPSNVRQYITEKSAKYSDRRPRVFFEIAITNVGVVGRMIAVLYSDYVPITVKNFLTFCNPKASLTYKGNFFYLIFQNYYCQTGDVTENKGFGGTSIYGPYFRSEDFSLKHSERGILTMHQKVTNRNDSQFLITFRKLESLNGQNVAFGKIVKGLHVLDAIESVGSKKTGRPKVEIYISDCDEI